MDLGFLFIDPVEVQSAYCRDKACGHVKRRLELPNEAIARPECAEHYLNFSGIRVAAAEKTDFDILRIEKKQNKRAKALIATVVNLAVKIAGNFAQELGICHPVIVCS